MKEYIFKKGELNSLNNINQDLKTVFTAYALCNNGVCVGVPILHKGFHHGVTPYTFPEINYETHMVIIESADLFKCIKDNKKDIIGYRIDDRDGLSLITNTVSFPIGSVLSIDKIAAKPFIEMEKNIPDYDETYPPEGLKITNVEDMVKNQIVNISISKYRTRISREVIPGLKKNHTVVVGFTDIDDMTFGLHLIAERACVRTKHIYKCLYI